MENNTIEKVMDKLDMFKVIFGKLYKFGLWDIEGNDNDTGTIFTSMRS